MTNEITNSNITTELIDSCSKTMILFFKTQKKYNIRCDEKYINETLSKLKSSISPYNKMSDEEFNTLKFKIMSNVNIDID